MDPSTAARRRLLIVSPAFAPANTPDSHRARLSLAHWGQLGWDVEVLAARGSDVDAPQEPELLDTIPAGIPVHRVPAWPRAVARLAGIGSLSRRAGGALRRAGDRLLARRSFDLVLFSTSQFGVFPLGPRWLRTTGTAYVLDFQDPWVTDYYDRPGAPRPPGGWKYRLARRQARQAEPECLRQAAGVVSVSARYLDDFERRYPWFDRKRACELPFPAADMDFSLLDTEPPERRLSLAPGCKHLVAVGAVGPYMRGALTGLFGAMARLMADAASGPPLRFHFIGTSYTSGSAGFVLPLARAAGVASLVEEHPARVAYLEALRWMRAGDALIVLGSDDPGYVPSRLANVLWTGKPLLSVASPDSALVRRLSESAGTKALAPTDEAGIAARLRQMAGGPSVPPPRLSADWRKFNSSAGMTRRLAEWFERWLKRG